MRKWTLILLGAVLLLWTCMTPGFQLVPSAVAGILMGVGRVSK